MSTNDFIIELDRIQQQINCYAPIFLLFFGILGNLLNCVAFTRRILRSNPCAVYFLIASLVNLINLPTVFIPRIISGWKPEYSLTETGSALCKIDLFILLTTRSIVSWMIVLATVYRYFLSSPIFTRRQLSNLKNAYRCVFVICIFLNILWTGTIPCFEAEVIGTPYKCYPNTHECGLYIDITQTLITVLIPVISMIIFGISIIRNIHHIGRVVPMNNNRQFIVRNRKREKSLTTMLFIQVCIFALLNVPFAIITLFETSTSYQVKSPWQIAVENFIFNFLYIAAFIPNSMSFFLFTFSGSNFS